MLAFPNRLNYDVLLRRRLASILSLSATQLVWRAPRKDAGELELTETTSIAAATTAFSFTPIISVLMTTDRIPAWNND